MPDVRCIADVCTYRPPVNMPYVPDSSYTHWCKWSSTVPSIGREPYTWYSSLVYVQTAPRFSTARGVVDRQSRRAHGLAPHVVPYNAPSYAEASKHMLIQRCPSVSNSAEALVLLPVESPRAMSCPRRRP